MIAVLGPRPHGRHGDHGDMAGVPGPRRRAQAAPATGSGDTAAVTQNTTTSNGQHETGRVLDRQRRGEPRAWRQRRLQSGRRPLAQPARRPPQTAPVIDVPLGGGFT
jgi:hypothetical protein